MRFTQIQTILPTSLSSPARRYVGCWYRSVIRPSDVPTAPKLVSGPSPPSWHSPLSTSWMRHSVRRLFRSYSPTGREASGYEIDAATGAAHLTALART